MKGRAMRGTGAPRRPDDPAQSERFKEAARELEADETGAAFTRALDVSIAPAKPINPPAVKSVTLRKPKRAKAK
jgi:hypothetical protein